MPGTVIECPPVLLCVACVCGVSTPSCGAAIACAAPTTLCRQCTTKVARHRRVLLVRSDPPQLKTPASLPGLFVSPFWERWELEELLCVRDRHRHLGFGEQGDVGV